MRGLLIFLGLLLVLGGGAVAAAQYVPVDLSMLDSVAGAREFLLSPMALYTGGGAVGFGLLLIIIAAATGGKKKEKPTKAAPAKTKAAPVKAEKAAPAADPFEAKPAPVPKQAEPKPASKPAPAPQPAAKPALQPIAAAAAPKPVPVTAPAAPAPQPAPTPPPAPKPVASAQPPASATAEARPPSDPRLMNRKRVQDLVSINDALKTYFKQNGAYPKAGGLAGFLDRGAAWIPGLSPEFIAELPRDPSLSTDKTGPQYVYVSDGKDYKLLAQGVSLVGGTNVEVLGVRIDVTRQPTPENAAFGFWTEAFAGA